MKNRELLRKRIHRMFTATGVHPRTPYQFQHTDTSLMLSSGARPLYVEGQLGHSSMIMLERDYA